jgi:PhnB protein
VDQENSSRLNDRRRYGSDGLPDAPDDRYQKPQGFSVSLQTKTPEEAERAFQALARGGSVRMPIQETFFATRFGMLVDQFGVPWMINCAPAA